MGFALPAALWGLALLPAVVLLRLAARRPRRLVVPSLIPWRLASSAAPSERRRRILFDTQLVLQLAAVAAAVLGLAGPELRGALPAGPRLAVVIDNSASMAAADRLGQARGKLRAEIGSLGAGARGSLWVTSPRPRQLAGPDADRSRLLEVLDAVRAADAGGDLAAAAAEARAAAGGGALLLVAADDLGSLEKLTGGVRLLPVGAPVRNLGIVAAAVEGGKVFAAVLNGGAGTETAKVELEAAAGTTSPLAALKPGQRCGFTFDLPPGTAGFVRLTVSAGEPDALRADDTVLIPAAPTVRPCLVAVEGRKADSTMRALVALGFPAPARALSGKPPAEARLVVAAGVWPERVPEDGFALVLDSPAGTLAGVRAGDEVGPAMATLSGELFPHAGGFGFPIASARGLEPGPGGQAVLKDSGRVLAAISADRRLCAVGFDPEATNWIRHGSFPVFLQSLAGACPALGAMISASGRTGEPAPSGFGTGLTAPSGSSVLPGEPLAEAGLYRAGGRPVFAANLLSAAETSCPAAGTERRSPVPASLAPKASRTELAPWLFALCLLALAAEWFLAWRGRWINPGAPAH